MTILPGELGGEWATRLIQRRTWFATGATSTQSGQTTIAEGPPSAWLAGGLRREVGVDAETTERILSRVGRRYSTLGNALMLSWGLSFMVPAAMAGGLGNAWLPALCLSGVAAGGAALGAWIPRWSLRRVCRTPVNESEVEALLAEAQDPLEKSYLLLLRDVLRHDGLPPRAEEELRTSLRTLGDALVGLPPLPPESASQDPKLLLDEAEACRQRGIHEADPTVSESLLRQAEALARSAEAIARSAQTFRRNAVLRDELRIQADALRLGLAAQSPDRSDTGDLTSLAEATRRVAAEAASLAAAKAELSQR